MYDIYSSIVELFKNNYRQVAKLTITLANSTVLNLNESNIIQGGLSIDRYCVSGNSIELGSAISSELNLKLDNRDGIFNSVNFEGATIKVEIGIKKWDARKWENATITYIPCGYFVVDETPRKLKIINLSALDYMTKFDKTFENINYIFPLTVATLLDGICTECGVTLKTGLNTLTNNDYSITNYPQNCTGVTYRELLQWIAQITGTCAFIDWDGELQLVKFAENVTIPEIKPSDRYDSDLQEQDITITGISFHDLKNNEYHKGTLVYPISIDGNLLIQSTYQDVVDTIWNECMSGRLTYRPFNATCKPMPYLYPLDKISFVDINGNAHTSLITHVNFTMNLNTKIESVGDTTIKSSYSPTKSITPSEDLVITKVKLEVEEEIKEVDDLSKDFNETINASLGLNKTINNGKYYFHDGTNLSNSTIIYTFGTNGFAWTTAWNDGNPTWSYGVDRSGNAILNLLKVYKLTADQITAKTITANEIAIGTITADQIKTKTITAAEIAANAITSEKIDAGAVTAEKITVTDLVSLNATIAGWTIESNYIGKNLIKLYSGDTTELDWQVNSLVTSGKSTCRIMVGGSDPLDGKFLVLDDGSVYAKAVSIQGTITGSSISGSTISGGTLEIGYNNLYKVTIQNGITEICGPVYFSSGSDFPFPSYVVLFAFMYQNEKYYLCARALTGNQGHYVTSWDIFITRNINNLGNGQQLSYIHEVM